MLIVARTMSVLRDRQRGATGVVGDGGAEPGGSLLVGGAVGSITL
jgi:hypothetical protein